MKTILFAALAAILTLTACGAEETPLPPDPRPLLGNWYYERTDKAGDYWFGWGTVTLNPDGRAFFSYADTWHTSTSPDVYQADGVYLTVETDQVSWTDHAGVTYRGMGISTLIEADQISPVGSVHWHIYRGIF